MLITSITNRYQNAAWSTRTGRYTDHRQLRANATRKLLLARVGSGNLATRMRLKFDRYSTIDIHINSLLNIIEQTQRIYYQARHRYR